jgi:hypothetical protein
MADMGSLASFGIELITNLPLFMQAVQIVAYVFFVLFYGMIASWGFRVYLGFWKGILLRIGLGVVCLVSGIALSVFMPFNEGLLALLQMNMFVAGIISSVVLAVALFLATTKFSNAKGIQREIEGLQHRLEKERNKKPAGEAAKSPATIAGIIIVAVFMGFVLLNFRGFPDLGKEVFSMVGLTDEDLQSMKEQFGQYANMGQECRDIINFVSNNSANQIIQVLPYQNETLKVKMEQMAGAGLAEMSRMDAEGRTMVIGKMDDGKTCFGTETESCICQ